MHISQRSECSQTVDCFFLNFSQNIDLILKIQIFDFLNFVYFLSPSETRITENGLLGSPPVIVYLTILVIVGSWLTENMFPYS